ncbi:GNAT family N-acetyltransferase [Companilactobacillus mishanensis]|uniref:N-acetyltransferase n=1 Tax=Companilactobacillus mishanensis TaxID=2486008 RepID=A0ABW9P6L3_9LACO|nr:GNAT family N-acetyltransferase [Companilactobacillus mishanensis]MQS44849.1 N-acetyltransferase [Companilactobacillus mishanensis]MQS89365.1 N-acetyltransferase [Companilactobacillus mishanensis]
MEIKQEEHRFYINDGEEFVGEITFTPIKEGVISIDHTFVDKKYGGQGLAGKLLTAMLEYAEKENLKIVPVCEYAKANFDKRPEIRYLLADNYQELLDKELAKKEEADKEDK